MSLCIYIYFFLFLESKITTIEPLFEGCGDATGEKSTAFRPGSDEGKEPPGMPANVALSKFAFERQRKEAALSDRCATCPVLIIAL